MFQTLWNLQSGRAPESEIKDYDLFYFDPNDLSVTTEQKVQGRVSSILADLEINLEAANQARVHLWYPNYFGRPYPALSSSEDGIRRFLVLETCVGVRPDECYAPYGLSGIYEGKLSPNPLTPYPDLFASKVESYRTRWAHLEERLGVVSGA